MTGEPTDKDYERAAAESNAEHIARAHRQLCHADGSECPDGCDAAPDPAALHQYRLEEARAHADLLVRASGRPDNDPRFTMGLLFEVFELLERHGFKRPAEGLAANHATARALVELLRLVEAFEGKEYPR